MFFKFTGANAPPLHDVATAERFVQELGRFPSRHELVWRLVDATKCPEGITALTTVLRFAVSESDGVTRLLVPLLEALLGTDGPVPGLGDMAFGTVTRLVRKSLNFLDVRAHTLVQPELRLFVRALALL